MCGYFSQALILDNAGPGRLSGTSTVPLVDGLAWFTDLSIDVWGDGYTLAFIYSVKSNNRKFITSGTQPACKYCSLQSSSTMKVSFETVAIGLINVCLQGHEVISSIISLPFSVCPLLLESATLCRRS